MDVEKTIEFLLEWQAKFSADMEIMKANLAREEEVQREFRKQQQEWVTWLSEKVRRHDSEIEVHTDWLAGLSFQTQQISQTMKDVALEMRDGFRETREQIAAVGVRLDAVGERLDAVGERLDTLGRETDERIRATDRQVQRTSESVDRLSATVDKLIPKPPVQ